MTMDVYARLEQRVKRDHGASFDRLVRQARELRGEDRTIAEAAELSPKVTGAGIGACGASKQGVR
jgi:hypothetical protein